MNLYIKDDKGVAKNLQWGLFPGPATARGD